MLVVLLGMDASGKDGTVRKVFDDVNPTGVQVVSFKQPTSEELRHDFLWRLPYQGAAAHGYIGSFQSIVLRGCAGGAGACGQAAGAGVAGEQA